MKFTFLHFLTIANIKSGIIDYDIDYETTNSITDIRVPLFSDYEYKYYNDPDFDSIISFREFSEAVESVGTKVMNRLLVIDPIERREMMKEMVISKYVSLLKILIHINPLNEWERKKTTVLHLEWCIQDFSNYLL